MLYNLITLNFRKQPKFIFTSPLWLIPSTRIIVHYHFVSFTYFNRSQCSVISRLCHQRRTTTFSSFAIFFLKLSYLLEELLVSLLFEVLRASSGFLSLSYLPQMGFEYLLTCMLSLVGVGSLGEFKQIVLGLSTNGTELHFSIAQISRCLILKTRRVLILYLQIQSLRSLSRRTRRECLWSNNR